MKMKISLNWIKEFTDVKVGVDELVTKIGAQLGEVEEVINLGERYEGIVVAKVVTCEKHPNADKLKLCKIDDGGVVENVKRDVNGHVQVVCGALNVRAGITVAWIPPGSIVPSSFDSDQFRLESRDLRGKTSNGMLASGKELTINDDHDGILIIDKPCNPGTLLAEVYKLDDYIIDIENKMFTHRPDCFGQLGVAREIAGIQGIKFTSPDWYLDILDKLSITTKNQLKLDIQNKLPDLVPRFMAVPIANVKVQKSPIMVQSFLSRVGVKPINNIVDITNFVMSLTAQPLHAYDYDKVSALDGDKQATLIIRKPKKGEKIALLNKKTIEPRADAIMIATKKELIGFGGVMGGTTTEIDDNTKNIILECANFDMYSIRRTSMTHGLFTDAVTRFNKGQSPRQNDKILAYAVAWLQKLAHGDVADKTQDDCNDVGSLKPIIVTSDFVNARLGTKLTDAQITKMLTNVEFLVESKKDRLYITAPYWRTDIEISEDIVEEIGRLYGYDKLLISLPKRNNSPATVNAMIQVKSKARLILSSAGANEVLTYSFVHGKLFETTGQDKNLAFQLSNALSPELQYYRLSLLPSLLDKVHSNIKAGHSRFALFEINKTHDKSNLLGGGLPVEEERLALVFVADKKSAKLYNGSAYYQARVYIDYLLASFGIKGLVFEPTTSHQPKSETGTQVIAPFEKSRSAYCKTEDGVLLGIVGEIKPEIKLALKLPEYIAGFELDLKAVEARSKMNNYIILSKFPKTQQDICLQVSNNLNYSQLYDAVGVVLNQAYKEHGYIWQAQANDIYQVNKKVKNITFRITLAHTERTLLTSEFNKLLDFISANTAKKFGAIRI